MSRLLVAQVKRRTLHQVARAGECQPEKLPPEPFTAIRIQPRVMSIFGSYQVQKKAPAVITGALRKGRVVAALELIDEKPDNLGFAILGRCCLAHSPNSGRLSENDVSLRPVEDLMGAVVIIQALSGYPG